MIPYNLTGRISFDHSAYNNSALDPGLSALLKDMRHGLCRYSYHCKVYWFLYLPQMFEGFVT